MDVISLLIGLAIGSVAAWLVSRYHFRSLKGLTPQEADALHGELETARTDNGRAAERISLLDQNLSKTSTELSGARDSIIDLTSRLSKSQADLANLQERLQTQKQEIEDLQTRLVEQFDSIANRILLDSSQQIQKQHKERLEDILTPLRDKIERFEKKVDDTHKENIRDNQSLKEQIASLQKLNQSIGEEAKNLTIALKGQSKTQGNWGEVILERILEKSGLVKGREYTVQTSLTGEDGRRLQPDVIINLPENKNLVIDSKVSLSAYERYCNVEDETQRAIELREHLASVRKHIKELGGKNYQNLYQLASLDFVLMFIPIEPAFNEAIHADLELYQEAFEKNIVIVSTSSLLATLRTIASIWRQENQSRNALEIARQGGDLYDKFVAFVDDLVQVGKRIHATDEAYQEAMKKLVEGKGNLVRRAEEMKSLGAKASKSMSAKILERAETDETTYLTRGSGDS